MPDSERRAILVLGMHRSGTSAVAGTAVRLGAALPATPLDASADNPTGFYESLPVVVQNHTILRDAGCAWNLCLHRDPAQICAQPAAEPDRLRAILRAEFGAARLFVIKDPRLCLILPAWLAALRAEGVAVSVLLVCRHPYEIARSLRRRNNLAEDVSVAQWLHHLLEAERATRGLPRALIHYPDLLADWRTSFLRAARMAAIGWPTDRPRTPVPAGRIANGHADGAPAANGQPTTGPDPAAAAAAVDAFLATELHHQRARSDTTVPVPIDLVAPLRGAWESFLSLRDDPHHPRRLAALDQAHAAFAGWRRAHYPSDLEVVWSQPV